MKLFVMLFGAIAFVPILILILKKWQRGFFMLLLWIPLSGIPTLLTNYSTVAILFKDFAFVIPTYIAFFTFFDEERDFSGIPKAFQWFLLGQIFLILVHMLNPNLANSLVAFIGAKVWLFYIPLFLISYSLAKDRATLILILRTIICISWIPASVGILQWALSNIIGYRQVMTFFYGQAAYAATQGFQVFNYGIPIYRLPSTFTFAAQYSTYLWVPLLMSFMLSYLDTSKKWRNFARVTLALVVVASFLSGARGAFFFVPLLLILTYLFQQGIGSASGVLLLICVLVVPFAFVIGLNLDVLFGSTWTLLLHYSKASVQDEFLKAVDLAPWGLGTGMNTIAARYACEGVENCKIGIENYYGKAIVELGILGGILLVLWQFSLIVVTIRNCRLLQTKELRAVAAACSALFIVMFISNVKSFRLDFEPLNMYYWIFVGFACRMNAIVLQMREQERLQSLHEQ